MSQADQIKVTDGRAYSRAKGAWVFEWYVDGQSDQLVRRAVAARTYPAVMRAFHAAHRKVTWERENRRKKMDLVHQAILNDAGRRRGDEREAW